MNATNVPYFLAPSHSTQRYIIYWGPPKKEEKGKREEEENQGKDYLIWQHG